ncbi:MAG: hypothetical protein COA79_10460 [Planctomycetota bacterium]|nr:MAG: hypothetical protein COA79_10460 [Planctomycetota bacterium]
MNFNYNKNYQFNPEKLFIKSLNHNPELIVNESYYELVHHTGHIGKFNFYKDEDHLFFVGQIVDPNGWEVKLNQNHPEWYFYDHVVFQFDPQNNHQFKRTIALMRDGELKLDNQRCLDGEEISDGHASPLDLTPLDIEKEVKEIDNGWAFKITIKLDSIRGDGKSYDTINNPIGTRISFTATSDIVYDSIAWPENPNSDFNHLFSFGLLVDEKALVDVDELDFGKPLWETGTITSSVVVSGNVKSDLIPTNIKTVIKTTGGRYLTDQNDLEFSAGSFKHSIPVHFPFASKWVPDAADIATVEIQICDGDNILWSTLYPFGFDLGIIVRDPFGLFSDKTIERPLPSDPKFVDNYRCWLFSKLPNWKPQTTKDGAPSDFFLHSERKEHCLNLMDEDVISQIATLIHNEFDDWQDGLSACSLILHHPCLTTHSGSWSKISSSSTTETVLRLRGCFCCDTARVASHVCDILSEKYNVPFTGYGMGLRGHVTGMIDTPIGEVLIDPMLGITYHTLDNTRLATLQEICGSMELQARVWEKACAHGHEFFNGVDNQTRRPYDRGRLKYLN